MALTVSAVLDSAAAQSGCSKKDLGRFSEHLEALPAIEAARINPFTFAEAAGIGRDRALDLFVLGTKSGLFDLEWGMVCPMCGAITHTVADLDRVAEDVLHCALCRRDAPSVLDDTVEVSFAYVPSGTVVDLHGDFGAFQRYHTSTSYPYRQQWLGYHARNMVADVKLAAGERAELSYEADEGEVFRLLCMDTHSGAKLQAAGSPASRGPVSVELTDAGFSRTELSVPSGTVTLSIANNTEQPVWCHVMRVVMPEIIAMVGNTMPQFGPRLTGKTLLNNQTFRDHFALDALAPDLKLKLRSLTLLFTDLKGSTALYDREGDMAAYRLVQDHFAALKTVVRDHSGALIKTMGDAVMAAFPTVTDGTSAAIEMMAAMQALASERGTSDVGLKVGLHAGPALAINAGRTLDYFGQTVNIAARVQGLADAGDICLTNALNDRDTVPALLSEAGYSGRSETARLKGVSAEERIFRYRMAA